MTAILQKAAEPSMEEILASIRRIIADDQTRVKSAPINSQPATHPVEPPGRAVAHPRLDSATVEAFPKAGKAAQPQAEHRSVADDGEAADDVEVAEPPASPAGPSEAAAQAPAAAANDARYFPPEAEFRAAPDERLSGRENAFAPDIEGDASSAPAIESAPRPGGDGMERGDIPGARSAAAHAPAPPDQAAIVPKLGAQPMQYRPALDGGVGSLADLSATAPAVARDRGRKGILSGEADAAIGRAFDTLRHTVLSDNARTLDDLVKDMLRPMLKGWLEDNLPPLVERLVRAEIERVARGRPA